jgi:hypothetical protein
MVKITKQCAHPVAMLQQLPSAFPRDRASAGATLRLAPKVREPTCMRSRSPRSHARRVITS